MNLFQQILSVSKEFREHFEKENQQEERIKALEDSLNSGGSSSPYKREEFSQRESFSVKLTYNGNAQKESGCIQGDSVLRYEIDNTGSAKYLKIYTEVDMGYYDEVSLRVYAWSSSIKDYTTSYLDNPFKETSGNLQYLKGDIVNGSSAVMFTAENIPSNSLLGKIKLPNKTGYIDYHFDLNYTKITFNS